MVSVRQRGPRLPKKPEVRCQNRRDPDAPRSTYQQSYWYLPVGEFGSSHDLARSGVGEVTVPRPVLVSSWGADSRVVSMLLRDVRPPRVDTRVGQQLVAEPSGLRVFHSAHPEFPATASPDLSATGPLQDKRPRTSSPPSSGSTTPLLRLQGDAAPGTACRGRPQRTSKSCGTPTATSCRSSTS